LAKQRSRIGFLCYLIAASGMAISANAAADNASNPLAAVDNTDLRWQHLDLESGSRDEYFIDGSKMLNPKLKLKYELRYWNTDVTGTDESDWSTLNLKAIYFPKDGQWNGRPYRLAVGLEWIKDLGDTNKGIGPGVDQIAPLAGVALQFGGTTLIPLIQHFYGYSGDDLNQTAMRLIGLKPLANQSWAKLDFKLPYDWENDAVPSSIELQLGRQFSPSFGLYVDLLAGVGGDKSFDSGVGIGARFNY
jgi:hypothetical protein